MGKYLSQVVFMIVTVGLYLICVGVGVGWLRLVVDFYLGGVVDEGMVWLDGGWFDHEGCCQHWFSLMLIRF